MLEKEHKVAIGATLFTFVVGSSMLFTGTQMGGKESKDAGHSRQPNHHVVRNASSTQAAPSTLSQTTDNADKVIALGDVGLKWRNGQITVSGQVKDQTEKERLLKAARAHFGADNVVDKIEINEAATGFWWKTRPFEVFAGLKKLSEFDLKLAAGNQIQLEGLAANDELKQQISTGLEQWFIDQPQVTANIQVDSTAKMEVSDNNALLTYPIEFATGSSEIPTANQAQLADIASLLADEGQKIKIIGYTDNVGDPAKNQQLSLDRANAVKNFLVSKGAISENIATEGLGQENPIGDNNTAEGRQKNRRIVFVKQ